MLSNNVNILLVEDDEVDAISVRRVLAKHGISNPLYVANDGWEALAMLSGGKGLPKIVKPCVVLLDINLPKMDGFEFLNELRKDPELRTTNVIMLTSSEDELEIKKAYDFDVKGYLIKPLVTEDLSKLLAQIA